MENILKYGLVIYVSNPEVMSNFYINIFGLKKRDTGKDFIALNNEWFELVLLQTGITESLSKEKNGTFEKRESTPLKPVSFVDRTIDEVRNLVESLGGGFKASKFEWKFNGYIVCDG